MKPDTVGELTKPFPKQFIKRTPQGQDYIPVAKVVDRMNNAIGVAKWKVEILNTFDWGTVETGLGTAPAHIMAHVRVHVYDDETGEWTWTEGMGGQDVGFYKDRSRGPLNLGDNYKGAVSDATKKALQHMGVAIELARGDLPAQETARPQGKPQPSAPKRAAEANPATGEVPESLTSLMGKLDEKRTVALTEKMEAANFPPIDKLPRAAEKQVRNWCNDLLAEQAKEANF